MVQVTLQEFNFEDMESTADWSSTYVPIQSCRQQRPLIVTQRLFHVSNTSEHLQLRPGATIILQFCVALVM